MMTVVSFRISSLKRLACILKKCGHEYLPSTVLIQVCKSVIDSRGLKLLHRKFLPVPEPNQVWIAVHKNLQKCRWQINLGFGGSFACYRRFKTRSYPVSTYRICTTARFQRQVSLTCWLERRLFPVLHFCSFLSWISQQISVSGNLPIFNNKCIFETGA